MQAPPPLMDLPPLPAAAAALLNHHEPSADSSPRYHHGTAEAWPDQAAEEPPLLPQVPGAKLRLMCSYGGHIMPRPHDKSLTYVGGDTRMVAVERHTSLKDLCSRLSRTVLHGRAFTLKYQLPNEDLDNLITVSTDDDLDSMIDEYDRLAASSNRPSRLRVFLFSSRLDTAVSMGSLLDDAKSETWFVDALNNSGILDRVVSDSAAVESLVSLDGAPAADASANGSDLEANAVAGGGDGGGNNNKKNEEEEVKDLVDVNSVENGGSRLQLVMEEQFAQLTFGSSAAVPPPCVPAPPCAAISDSVGHVVSHDDDTSSSSDHHHHHVPPPSGYRKPPLPLQLVHPPRTFATFGLPSPDSVASDSSIASANSLSKGVYYQEQQQREQVQDSSYTLPQQQQQVDHNHQLHQHHQQQQQFVYIQQHHNNPASTGQVPMSASYYPVYAPPIPSLHHHQQQYPAVYVMPVGPTQPYTMTMQPNIIPDPNVVAYKDATPPINYPTKLVSTSTFPDLPPKVASTPPPAAAAFVQIPSNQFQQQYMALPQNVVHPHPTQPTAIAPSSATSTNYGYDQYGGGPTSQQQEQVQVYYTQQQSSAPQYQSMTPAAAAAALSDVSIQFPVDNIQQPTRNNAQPV